MNMRHPLPMAVLSAVVLLGSLPTRALAQGGAAAALPAGVERVTSVEGITEYRLANGLRVLLFPDQTKQTITVNITYLVGSRHENYGETGMAHLLEHLVFKGTDKHKNIPQELTQHGASPNGTTWYDRTNYFETFAATDENLDWALDLESDRMVNSYIAKKDLDSEMTVVRNEYESGENSPGRILQQRVSSTAYLWHNYGKSTIGAKSDLENVPIDRLQAFYRRYYQPDNSVLLVAGKFDPVRTLGIIATKFGAIPKPDRTLSPIYTVEPTQDGERAVTVRRTGDTQLVMTAYHIPPGLHPDYAAIDVLAEVLGDTPSGRLHKSLVESKKASSAYGFSFQQHDQGLIMFGAEVRKEDSIDAARDELIKTIESFATAAPSTEEVERAKTGLVKNIELTLNDANRVGLSLSEFIAMGDWRLFFINRDRLKTVTPADVQRVAAAYLKPSNRTTGMFIPTEKPDRAEIPVRPDVVAMVKDYKGQAAVAEGEAFDPSPANIQSRTSLDEIPGGLKLTFLPKKTRGATVNVNLTLRFGDEKSLMGKSTAAEAAGEMLMRGTTKHTRQQIKDEFDRLKARVNVGGSAASAFASIESPRENLPAVLRLVAEILREPAFPVSEFDLLEEESLAGIESQRSEPQSIAFNFLLRTLNPFPKGDIRYVETPDEEIASIKATTIEDAKAFHRDFYGASFGELAAVGDFDPKELKALVTELFGGWKSPKGYTRVPNPFPEIAPANKVFETPDKANAFFLAAQVLPLRDDDADYPAIVLGGYMLGGGFLNSRLAVRIRQKEGLSYGVGAGISASSLDKRGQFTANAIYAPQNVAKLEAAFREEIDRMLKDGFTADEIAGAKSGWLQSRQVQRSNDGGLAGRLNSYRFLGRTIMWDADLESKISALTPEQISAAMRKYLDPNKFVIVKAGDYAKASAAAAAPK